MRPAIPHAFKWDRARVGLIQGAELMSQYGINVPPGIAIKSLDEVQSAAQKMASPDGEVSSLLHGQSFKRFDCTHLT